MMHFQTKVPCVSAGPRAAPPAGRVPAGGRGAAGAVRGARAGLRAQDVLPRAARAAAHLRPVRRLHTGRADHRPAGNTQITHTLSYMYTVCLVTLK